MNRTDSLLPRLLIAGCALAAACGDRGGAPSTEPGAPPTAPGAPPATSGEPGATEDGPPAVALDDAPDVDLVDNRFRWHLFRDGLLMPAASEGFRKYVNEYSDPWGDVVTDGDRFGRTLESRRAVLRFPWSSAEPAALWLRMHGVASRQRMTVTINDKRVGTIEPAAQWETAVVEIPADVLRAGENELRLELRSRGALRGARAYAVVHSIEVVAAGAEPPDAWPPLSPADTVDARPVLTGFGRMSIYVEVPRTAWLELATSTPSDGATFTVEAQPIDGDPVTLLRHEGRVGSWQDHRVDLAKLGGKLVELRFRIDGAAAADAAWGGPRIALAAAERSKRPPPVDNAVLVVVDALRSDRLAVYGDTRVRTPRITKEARERGVVFLNNQAASPSSPPSHGSIQTGMIPRVHGVTGDKGQLESGTPMISTVLGDAGIATSYIGNNAFGMGRLEKPGKWTEYHQPVREGLGIDCEPLVGEILKFAEAQSKEGKRFFVSSLPYETHVPYRYHEGITDHYHEGKWDKPIGKEVRGETLGAITGGRIKMNEQSWSQLKALYDGEAEHMDGCFGKLIDGLAELELLDKTAIILTSDHGEGMYEHGRMGHAFGHWGELGNVPFIVISPGLVAKGISADTPTSHIDIAPTIVDLLGVDREPRMQGESVVPVALRGGEWVPRVVSLEYGRSYALRARQWRYIVEYSGNELLYDLEADPTEQTDVTDTQPMALRYFRDLTGFFLAHRKQWRAETWGTLNNHGPGFLEAVGSASK